MKAEKVHSINLDGQAMPVLVSRNPRAKNMTLRLEPSEDTLKLVLPYGVAVAEGMRFVHQREGWIKARLAQMPPRVPFAPGAMLPLLGHARIVQHEPKARRGVWEEADVIFVSGEAEHLPRRLRDWLKEKARREIVKRAEAKAEQVRKRINRISLRDPKGRWGSCSPDANLSFSWRLIFAPKDVLDYVVAHEVAHLVELNHSVRFWRLVQKLTHDAPRSRAWLKRHGNALLRYG
jgi:predicted metal-dependent hydrolase